MLPCTGLISFLIFRFRLFFRLRLDVLVVHRFLLRVDGYQWIAPRKADNPFHCLSHIVIFFTLVNNIFFVYG